jgi:hypothetical protein
MRTTVTIDPDVEVLLRQAMSERGLSFKEALNQAVRAGLRGGPAKRGGRVRFKTYPMGLNPRLNFDKALQLAGEYEDEEITRKLQLRK